MMISCVWNKPKCSFMVSVQGMSDSYLLVYFQCENFTANVRCEILDCFSFFIFNVKTLMDQNLNDGTWKVSHPSRGACHAATPEGGSSGTLGCSQGRFWGHAECDVGDDLSKLCLFIVSDNLFLSEFTLRCLMGDLVEGTSCKGGHL